MASVPPTYLREWRATAAVPDSLKGRHAGCVRCFVRSRERGGTLKQLVAVNTVATSKCRS